MIHSLTTATFYAAIVTAWLSGATISADEVVATPVRVRTGSDVPKFGFESQLIVGYGEQVTFVERGSQAFRLGLEEQDVILMLNDKRLTRPGAWQAALLAALENGGVVTLKVRDARTGAIAIRRTNLRSD
jgi:hypothetical protein